MKKKDIEFRYYDMPVNSYVLAMLGDGWEQEYGIEQAPGLLHFHNYLEIGYCYDGSGILTIADQKLRYSGNMFSIIPANIPHTTNSDPGHICKWEFLFIDIEPFVRNEMRDALISVSRALQTINGRGRSDQDDYRGMPEQSAQQQRMPEGISAGAGDRNTQTERSGQHSRQRTVA